MTTQSVAADALRLLRDLAPQVLGAVARRHGDWADAEDAVQEALLAAATQWPRDGLPENPRGWLIQIAAKASAAPGPGGAPLNMPIEVRQVMSGPPKDA